MEDTVVQPIPCTEFLLRLSRDALLEGFVRYLAVRLAQTRLDLAHQLGHHDQPSIRIVPKISTAAGRDGRHDAATDQLGNKTMEWLDAD